MVLHLGPENGPWRILDFGCGTGFESLQVLRLLPTGSIRSLVCYDPSPEMLSRCRLKVASVFSRAVFTSNYDEMLHLSTGVNLLLTNSLLHHLPDPYETIAGITSLMAHDAFWLAGHEPSNRFYRNSELLNFVDRFFSARSWLRFMDPNSYKRRVRTFLRRKSDSGADTARAAVAAGLFELEPPRTAIDRLVDFHVAHSATEVSNDRGFDFEAMAEELVHVWERTWVKTYSYFGTYPEYEVPTNWRRKSRTLAASYPKDGANFCSVWRRT